MRGFHGSAPLWTAAVVLLLSFPCTAQSAGGAGNGPQLFAEKCAVCHTVGGGDGAGPDLIAATRRSPAELRLALRRMQDNVGPLTAGDVDALIALLRNPNVKTLLAAGQAPQPIPKAVEIERGSPGSGQRLFFGEQRFANGGSPCFGCHTVGGRGGNLAADLTLVRTRMGPAALVATAGQPAFPLMKAAYARHAVTEEEAFDLSAFLKRSSATAKPGPQPRERTAVPRSAAAGAAAIVLAGTALILRRRQAGLRSRVVRRATTPGGAS